MNKIHTTTTRQIETDDGHMLDLPFSDPWDNTIIEDTLILKNAGAERPTFGGYLIHDDNAYDCYEFPEGSELVAMSPDPDADPFGLYVIEQDMRHEVAYHLTDDPDYATHILTIPSDVPASHTVEYAKGILSEYSSVCSGDSYCVVIAAWDHHGHETNSSIIGGYHGLDWAMIELSHDLKTENEYTYR